MPKPDIRPTCSTCHFSRDLRTGAVAVGLDLPSDYLESLKIQFPGKPLVCLRDPVEIEKHADDFCRHHPAWKEFEAVTQGEAVSDWYASNNRT